MERHAIQFYNDEQILIEKIASFIDAGFRAGETCIVFAPAERLRALESSMLMHDATLQENYTAVEACALLTQFVKDAGPDRHRFIEVMTPILSAASANGSRQVRIVSEMAALLSAAESHAAAFQLEQLCSELARNYPLSLLSVYPAHASTDVKPGKPSLPISDGQSHAHPPRSTGEAAALADTQRTIALLQEKVHTLEAKAAMHRRAEELALQQFQESEERFRSLVDMSSDWYWEQDAWMRFTKVFPHRSGAPGGDRPEEALGLTPWELPVECDEATRHALNTALEARAPYHDLESWLSVPGKPTRCFVSSGKPMFDVDGQFIGYRGVTKDVTERVRTIEDLRRFRAAMDATTDAIFLVDHATLSFVDANAAACRLVGYTREELLSLSGADLASTSMEALKALSDDLVNGKDRGVETLRMRHKDGSKVLVEMQRRALSSGPDWIIVVVARDIRERRRTEAALRQSEDELRQLAAHQEHIKEEERKRIAREIHDELGGVLTGIKANISVSMDRAASAGIPTDPLLEDAVRLADAAIETVRRVISDLRPSVLDQLGVWAALEWYAQQVQTRTGLQCSCIVSNSAAVIEPDPERSTMLFRVVQEALTNVVRHAAASHVAINVWREEDALQVEIRDDGKGIDAQRLLDGESWGILGMHERARHFGGNIKFSGAHDKGTAVLLHLPLENTNYR